MASGHHGKTGALVGLGLMAALQVYSVASSQGTDVPGGTLAVLAIVELGVGAGAGFLVGSAFRWARWEPGAFPPISPR